MSVTDEIKQRLDIVEVIGGYVNLRKAGRNYQGLCPFHSEKTPSFVVFSDTQSWHCFGACGTGGDIFSFIEKREKLDFGEALKLLAERAGVELHPREGPPPAAERHLERLRELLAGAAGYFHHLLIQSAEGAVARAYLERRGFTQETWEAWQLGYALNSWDAARDHLLRAGFTIEELNDAGLVILNEERGSYYDRFRGRLMIPIRDVQGRTIGFGARILIEDPERPQPKYINSPQTPLFDKSSVLFGLDAARRAIRDADLAVLVEGYMDVMMSHQVGVKYVVAGMGTALTEQQLAQFKRYTRNVTLALDPDAAGIHAALRGLDTARATMEREWQPVVDPGGLVRQESRLRAQLRIAALPEGLDPDELAYRDRSRWEAVIAEAQPVVDYYLDYLSREEDLATARGKANLVARMAPLVREVANPIERNHYVQRIARLVQTDERLVAEQVQRAADGPRPPRPVREGLPGNTARPAEAEPGGEPRSPRPASGSPRPVREGLSGDAIGPVQVEPGGEARSPRGSGSPLPVGEGRGGEVRSFGLEEHLLSHLLLRPDLMPLVDNELIGLTNSPFGPDDLAGGENRAVLAAIRAAVYAEAEPDLDGVLDAVPEELRERCLAWIERARGGPALPDDRLLKELAGSALRLRARNLDQAMRRLQFLILESETAGEREQLQEYKSLMVTYAAQERRLQKLLHARTMIGSLNKDNETI